LGPAGPDEEERARPAAAPAQEFEEPRTTLTLTVAETAPTESAPAATPPPAPRPTPSPVPTPAEAAPAPTATPAAEKNEAPKKTPVSGGVLNSKAIDLPRPTYPPTARSAGVYGTVTVEVTIDERGSVSEVRVLNGHPLLHQAAITAARQAKFSPTVLSGEPVRVKGTINYNFTRQ
ncbi:MAG TPA: energy transducer TonB, partial [Pyrinomonadaceae bacterium]|nr:energy transducer TonB [Pyrinomonadaceae bacterium]